MLRPYLAKKESKPFPPDFKQKRNLTDLLEYNLPGYTSFEIRQERKG